MEILKQRILKDGVVKEGNVLKVDKFLNHQMDGKLFNDIGEEFAKRFAGTGVNKILTIESSGIGIACIAAQHFNNCPVIFAKKTLSKNLDGEMFVTQVKSYTKGVTYDVMVSATSSSAQAGAIWTKWNPSLRNILTFISATAQATRTTARTLTTTSEEFIRQDTSPVSLQV